MILFFGDTQLKSDRSLTMDDWDLAQPSKDKVQDMCKTAYWIADMIEEYNPDTVVFLGDLNEELGKLSLFSIYLIKQAFDLIIDDDGDRQYYFLVGNHDTKDPTGLCNSLILLPDGDNIHKVLPGCPVKLDNMLFASFMPSAKEFTSIVNSHDYETLVTHMPIQGMEFNTGFAEQAGLDPADFKGKQLIVGHYHKPDVAEMKGAKILSVGAPMYHDFRDEYDSERGVLLVDGGNIGRESNPYARRYIQLKEGEIDSLDSLVKKYGEENLHVRLFAEEDNLEDTSKAVDKFKFASVKVFPIKKETVAQREKGISMETTYEDDINNYVDMQGSLSLDKDKLVSIGLEMIK